MVDKSENLARAAAMLGQGTGADMVALVHWEVGKKEPTRAIACARADRAASAKLASAVLREWADEIDRLGEV